MSTPASSIRAPLADLRPDRILLIRPSALGDVCRSVPVLASLRAAYPAARIDWLVQDSFIDAVRAHPALSLHGGQAIPFPRKRFARWYSPSVLKDLSTWLGSLRSADYNLVIDAQGLLRSSIFARATRSPVRIGYANAPEAAWINYTHRVHAPNSAHAVTRMLELLTPLGIPPLPDLTLHAPPEDREAVEHDHPFRMRYAVIAPTTRWPSKLWPAARFAAVAQQLLTRGFDHIFIVGGPSEETQCPELITLAGHEPRVVNLIGQTRIGRLMAIIEHASLVIGSDSAVIHIASGYARPAVALFGPTDVSRVGPADPRAIVLQHVAPNEPINHKSAQPGQSQMARISIDEVLAACDKACAR